MCIQMDVDCVFTQCASRYCGTGLLRVLDHRQVSQLVVIDNSSHCIALHL